MSSTEYISSVHACRSYKMIRNQIFHKSAEMTKKRNESAPVAETIEKQIAVMPTFADHRDDDSVLITIQNDQKLLRAILSCRKQKRIQVLVFVEPDLNVVLIIKSPLCGPVIMIKIPFSDSVYGKAPPQMAFEFPIIDVLNQIKNSGKMSSSYEFIFKRKDDNSTSFISSIYGNNGHEHTSTVAGIISSHIQIVHNSFSDDLMKSKGRKLGSSIVGSSDFLSKFYQVNLIILKEIASANVKVFTKPLTPKTKNLIIINNKQMKFKTIVGGTANEEVLCTSEKSSIWLQSEEKTYKMIPYDSLFKKALTPKTSNDEKYYYVFAPYLNGFVFIKISTVEKISEDQQIKTLIKLFSNGYQMLECYMCREKLPKAI